MKSRILAFLFTLLLLLSLSITASADEPACTVFVGDIPVLTGDYKLFGSTPYMKVGAFFMMVSTKYCVTSDGTKFSGTCYYSNGQKCELTAKEGDSYICVNDRYLFCRTEVKQIDGAVALPVGMLAKAVGGSATVYADNSFHIKCGALSLRQGSEFYNNAVIDTIARTINSEAGNQCMEGKIAVGNVIVNRVLSSQFPNSVADVILAENQFDGTKSKYFYVDPPESCVIAAKIAVEGSEVLPGILYFNRAGQQSWAARAKEYVGTIQGHDFYK